MLGDSAADVAGDVSGGRMWRGRARARGDHLGDRLRVHHMPDAPWEGFAPQTEAEQGNEGSPGLPSPANLRPRRKPSPPAVQDPLQEKPHSSQRRAVFHRRTSTRVHEGEFMRARDFYKRVHEGEGLLVLGCGRVHEGEGLL